MHNFMYYAPTKILFGKGVVEQTGALLQEQACRRVLLHYGNNSAQRSGVLDQVRQALTAAGLEYVTLGGVSPNPRLSLVYEGIELCRAQEVDFILAIGGGSVIDSAKAIGYGVANPGDVWDFYDQKRQATACLPLGAVLTIAAAGSEMSNSSVITKDEGLIKRGYGNDLSRLRFAVLDPELTMTLPPYQTMCGCVDIMMHTLERYLSGGENMTLTDGFSEHLLRTVMRYSTILQQEPRNYAARAEIMWAGSLSHNGLTGCGTDGGDWATHQIEHELSGMFDVAHGAGLAAVWASWARYVMPAAVERFALLAQRVMSIPSNGDVTDTALKGIEAMENFFHSLAMPTSLRELGIDLTPDQGRELAAKCCYPGRPTVGRVKKLDKDDVYRIYMAAR